MTVTLFLYKYDDPAGKFAEIMAAKGKEVIFYPHADGGPIQNRVGYAVPMYVENIVPFYLFQTLFYDAVKIKFISNSVTLMTTLAQSLWGYGYTYGSYYGDGM